jgi:hypothetical protein
VDNGVGLACLETVPVQFEEQRGHRESDPLVAVDKRAILHEPEAAAGSQVESVRFSAGEQVFGARQRRLQRSPTPWTKPIARASSIAT